MFALPEGVVVKQEAGSGRKRALEQDPAEVPEEEEAPAAGLRSGKWTKEEEVYADALIEKFESGTLPDCPRGKTLRAYLSQKLNCIPMRVSKKYGGKCIGKHSYTPAGVGGVESAEEAARMEQLAQECWAAIERRIKNRRKRVNRNKAPNGDSHSDAGESTGHSEATDKEDLFLDDLLQFSDFFPDVTEENTMSREVVELPEVVDNFDWSDLSDDCLLFL